MAKKRLMVQVVRTQVWLADVEVESEEELQKLISESSDCNREADSDMWTDTVSSYAVEVIDKDTSRDISGEYQLRLPPWACE